MERKVLQQGTPLRGICVGAPMLATESAEGTERGLGWFDMRVRRFPEMSGQRVPHMGRDQVKPTELEGCFS